MSIVSLYIMKRLFYHENTKVRKHEILLGLFSCFRHFVFSGLIIFRSGLTGYNATNFNPASLG